MDKHIGAVATRASDALKDEAAGFAAGGSEGKYAQHLYCTADGFASQAQRSTEGERIATESLDRLRAGRSDSRRCAMKVFAPRLPWMRSAMSVCKKTLEASAGGAGHA